MRLPRQNQVVGGEGEGGAEGEQERSAKDGKEKICFQVPQTHTAVLPPIPRPPGSGKELPAWDAQGVIKVKNTRIRQA